MKERPIERVSTSAPSPYPNGYAGGTDPSWEQIETLLHHAYKHGGSVGVDLRPSKGRIYDSVTMYTEDGLLIIMGSEAQFWHDYRGKVHVPEAAKGMTVYDFWCEPDTVTRDLGVALTAFRALYENGVCPEGKDWGDFY